MLVDDDEDDDISPVLVPVVMKDNASTSSDGSVNIYRKRHKIEKGKDDNIPLPIPFPLPKYFRHDVQVALTKKQMTKETRSHFFSAVASAMLTYKPYPTAEDYKSVASSITEKYEFMKSPVGTPTVC